MELAVSALSSAVPKLAALLQEEVKLTKGLKREVKFLVSQLQVIQVFISQKMEAEPTEVQAILLRDARELSYDIEDSIDGFMFHMKHEAAGLRGIMRIAHKIVRARSRHEIANDIKEMKLRMNYVMELMKQWHPDSTVSRPNNVDPRLTASYMEASALVGVGGPRDELIKLLLTKGEEEPESAARLKVISIVGSGGLGKTTLAKVVYDKIQVQFDCAVWVSLSPKPDLKKILINVLRQFQDPHISVDEVIKLDERDLICNISNFLRDKRYLFIMDDIWSPDVWDILRCALPMNFSGSRIIVTTCINSVAESCCSHRNDHIYNIKPLSLKDSRLLFHTRIFGSEDKCPSGFLDVSDKILYKCYGLPLAIITISSLLVTRPLEKREWENVYNSIGATSEETGLKSMFLLSYNNLPQHLKVCLLYLSRFPEDYLINCDRVVRSWIAEGFIWTKHGRTAEEVGESYLNELINRHMIHPVHGSYGVKPEVCLIHGVMHDLIKTKSIEENFVTLLDNGEHVPLLHGKIRRLSIFNISKDCCIPELLDKSHIRSLCIFGSVGLNLSFKHFTFLRLLDLEGCKDLVDHNIKDVPGLIHLSYLSLRDTNISELPDQIGQLQSLKTLDLRGTKVQELPAGIVQLQMLAHLLCDKIRFPEGIGNMAALSCLSQVEILPSNITVIKELGNLSELRELVLWWCPDIESNNTLRNVHLAISLYRLDKLESLCIHGSDCSVDFLDCLHYPLRKLRFIQLNRYCYLNRIPERFSELLPSLAYLCIYINEVKNVDMQLLSELPLLLQLSLSSKAIPTEKLVISSKGFPVLRKFHLHCAKEDLKIEPHAMQKLEELVLSLHALPEDFSISIRQFKCIKKIDIIINGKGIAASQLFEPADVAIRKAADEHPNHPVVNIIAQGNLIDYEAMAGHKREEVLEVLKDY